MHEANLIIHINSYPGVRKLTIGSHLAELLDGKLLDSHSIYNVAFALTGFRNSESPACRNALPTSRPMPEAFPGVTRSGPPGSEYKFSGLPRIRDIRQRDGHFGWGPKAGILNCRWSDRIKWRRQIDEFDNPCLLLRAHL